MGEPKPERVPIAVAGTTSLGGARWHAIPMALLWHLWQKGTGLPGTGLLLPSLAVSESSQIVGGGKLSRAGCAHLSWGPPCRHHFELAVLRALAPMHADQVAASALFTPYQLRL